MPTIHEPVLLNEVLTALNPQPGQNYIDCTFGGGGHSLAIVEKIKPDGKLLGIDWDKNAVADSHNNNLILINDNYRNLKRIYQRCQKDNGLGGINGILLDLGLSSDQLSDSERGFSFDSTGPLDMRFDENSETPTAAEIIMTKSQDELTKIFEEYGDEPLAKIIAKSIVAKRQKGEDIQSAAMLVRLITDIYRHKFRQPSKINPATRVLMALRIAVNDEFGNIRKILPQALDLLQSGGRLAVISFHSGEDRIIKNFFRDWSKGDLKRLKIITKKPLIATDVEIKRNPRARSAKLRVAEKL
jgi:16S rRNA (cytosine1402-N4)-methyltransferase